MTPEDHSPSWRGAEPRLAEIDELDALLTQRRADGLSRASRPSRAALAPLLDAADALTPLASAQMSSAFADRLEARLLAHIDSHAPTLPMTQQMWAPDRPLARARAARPAWRTTGEKARQRPNYPTWIAVAACLILLTTVGALTASAHPGAPFYPLRKTVEGISAALTDGPATSARASLQRASADLAAFSAAAVASDDRAALTALNQLTQDDHQAADAIAQVSDSNERAALQTQLDGLRAQEISGLRAGLATLGWPARIQVTSALRALNATSLSVISARILVVVDSSHHAGSSGALRVIVNGSGFTSGAVLLINGRPAGVVDAVTADLLTAHVAAGALDEDTHSVGVGEPDGTAASTSHVAADDHDTGPGSTPEPGDDGTPDPNSTPEAGGAGTPTPRPSPGATPSGTPGAPDN